MGFGSRLRAARKAKGYTGLELGRAVGACINNGTPLSKQTISHWENEHTSPSVEEVVCLCTLLGVSADYLLLDIDHIEADSTLQDFSREYKKMSPEQKAVWKQILSTAQVPPAQPTPGAEQGKVMTDSQTDERTKERRGRRFQ